MKKIAFILDHKLMDYRIPLFQRLVNKGFELTVLHGGEIIEGTNFKQIKTNIIKLGLLEYRKIPNLKEYDLVIAMQNIRILNIWAIALNPFKRYKLIFWGIGVSSSGGLQKRKNMISWIRNFLSYFADGLIFYSKYALKFYSKSNNNKSTIANNTIENDLMEDLSKFKKSYFLFIGSLNKRKGISELLQSFNTYLKTKPNNIKKLVIIGEGPERQNIEKYIKEKSLKSDVILMGHVSNREKKKELFKNAICSISPNQAGLSVLECFSYGVPFITKVNAISGGEHLNIMNGTNGFLLNSEENLVDKMLLLDRDPEKAVYMGRQAFDFYKNERTMEYMVKSFEESIRKTLGV